MMDSSNWLLALLNTGAFLLCVGFLVYVIVIMRPYLSIKELPPGDSADNDWHLIVPALNEEEVIGGTVLHLTTTFPQAHVWVIDDGSDDATGRSWPSSHRGCRSCTSSRGSRRTRVPARVMC